jgi:pSer/pThr/pTyr-binding forkhead associated (FHA) protein
MRPALATALLAAVFAVSLATAQQPDSQKMGNASALVFGAISDGKQGVNLVSRGGGFFIDSRHAVSNVQDCCGKTDKGEQVTPIVFVGKDDAAPGRVIWSNDDTEIAILELTQALNHPGVTISPGKLQQQGESVYSVQYPKPGDNSAPQLMEGKLTGSSSAGDKNIPLFKTTLALNSNNAGGALFDACANVIGINLTVKDGAGYAFVVDPLVDALKASGLQPNVTDQPCGGSSRSEGTPPSKGSDKDKDGKEGEKRGKQGSRSPWRGPQGSEWVPVAIVAVLLVLAFRPARKKVAQVVTGRYQLPPQVQPYQAAPYQPMPDQPVPYAVPSQPYAMPAPAPLAPAALRPVLRGVAGQYAGSSFPLESGSSTLGRDPSAANLVFTGDAASVSKRHCSVRWDAGRGLFLLEDHGSTNGTFLASGERLTPNLMRELRAGDRFYIGDTRNQFEVALEP